jgi:small neutral amino acid transporter SnatA (MarC family)
MEEQAIDKSAVVRELGLPLLEGKGWIKFVGIFSVIQGVIMVFSVVGILIAWLPIWIGVLLYQSASILERAYRSGDTFTFCRAMGKLRTYFVIQGVMTLLGIILVVLVLALGLVGAFFEALR